MINDNWCLIMYLAGNCWNDSDKTPWCNGEIFNTKLLTEKKAWREVVDMAAENGIDSLYINLANGIRYESHPEIAIEGAWTTDELKEELSYIYSKGLKAYPRLNFSAGHDVWLGIYSRMVSTPKYYEVVRDLIFEVCDLFNTPEMMAIEMDEENGLNQGRVQYACYRQRDLQWHDINYLCDCIRQKGVRPNIDADYYWSFPEEFLANVPRDVIISNWFYNNLYFDAARPKLTDPWSTKRLESFKELTEAGYDLWLQGGSNESTFNFEHNVRYATENAVLDKIVGMAITGCWSPVNDSSKNYYFDAIYQAKYTREQFFGGI